MEHPPRLTKPILVCAEVGNGFDEMGRERAALQGALRNPGFTAHPEKGFQETPRGGSLRPASGSPASCDPGALDDRHTRFDFMDPPNPKTRWVIQIAKLVQVGALGGLLSVPVFEGIVPESAGDFVVYGLLYFVVPGTSRQASSQKPSHSTF